MNIADLLADALSRPLDATRRVLDGISPDALHARPDGHANPIGWLVWHAFRQQDVQVAQLEGTSQVWGAGGWAERTGIERTDAELGFGDSPEAVASLHVADAQALLGYAEAVTARSVEYVGSLEAEAWDDVVDTHYDPPVTRGVRLVSIVDDAVAHLGQAEYARGVVERWSVGY